MIRTQAFYFDGVSSKSQQVELLLDTTNCMLVFYHSAGIVKRWSVYDLKLHQIAHTLEIQYGGIPSELLKITDNEFIKALKKLLREIGHVSWYQKLLDLGFKVHALIGISILGLILVVYLFVLPKIAEKAVYLIPESYDNSMGATFFHQYAQYGKIDSSKSMALTEFAGQLNLENTKELKFTVFESGIINAFALPDGNIVVFTGIINEMEDYDELAGLICHEAVHINERHSMKMLCRNLSNYIFLAVALSDVNSIIAVIGDNINSLQSLTYSRHFEKEADIKGAELLIANNINPVGMENLFKRLQKKSDNMVPEFVSSHPITINRIHYIDRIVRDQQDIFVTKPELRELFREIKN